mgnify:FL=1
MENLVDVLTHELSEMKIDEAEAEAILKGAEFAREKQQEDYKDWKIEIETDSLPGKLKVERYICFPFSAASSFHRAI